MAKLCPQHDATMRGCAEAAPNFLSTPLKLNVVPQHWYVVYTAPRHEKAVAAHLEQRSIEAYLPLFSSARIWNRRRAVVQLPLFPGYIFVRIRSCDRLQVLEVPGVIRLIACNGCLTPIPDDLIEALKASLQLRASQPHPFLCTGKRVRIAAGPLKGLEGVIVREANAFRMIVSIESIMRSFSVELDASDLEGCVTPNERRVYRDAA